MTRKKTEEWVARLKEHLPKGVYDLSIVESATRFTVVVSVSGEPLCELHEVEQFELFELGYINGYEDGETYGRSCAY